MRDVGEWQVGADQRAAETLLVALQQLRHRAIHVHLVEQVQPAAQVQAQRHRPSGRSCAASGGAREAFASAFTIRPQRSRRPHRAP
jgi:hypothetical protein